MTDILLHDEELENDQEDSLIQIMLHSAQRTGKKPPKPTSTKAQKLFQEDEI
ncbi:Hypothetical protein FKW44_003964 [Caligus rogercresseyi]|uniref:Uncharacterized protein n=1 Tax=Caligus rogercresseyi TaxID=217165 RepID=A0A7T8KAB5_CALRO|nr:Hypothetical protein FKW44_003964 [Caligus rogercresseyi]